MLLDNRHYDTLKWIALILLPALAVLVGGLGDLYQITYRDQVVQTINLLATFLGALLQISSHHYHQS